MEQFYVTVVKFRSIKHFVYSCRQKKAKAEAAKLSAIQRELSKLDLMVNADVSIIRDRIENSSRDFLEAQ